MSEHRRSWRIPVGLFGSAFAVFVVTTNRGVAHVDYYMSSFSAWRITAAGSPYVDGVHIAKLDDLTYPFLWVFEAANGHTVVGRSPGTVLANIPAYALAGTDQMTMWPAAVTAALITALSVVLFFLTVRTRLTDRQALLCALAFAFATPVWSTAADGVWPHTVTVLGITGMAWASATGRWWLAGVFGGVTLWGRVHAAVIPATLGIVTGAQRRSLGPVIRVGLGSVAGLALLCAWSRWMYGTWSPTASYEVTMFTGYADEHGADLPNALAFLISPNRGLLVWTPIIVLLLPAVVRSWRELPDWSRSLAFGGLVYTLIQAYFNRYSGGEWFWGYRLSLELLACVGPAIAFSTPRMGRWARRLAAPVVGLQLGAMLIGATTTRFYVLVDEMWHDNALLLALREVPAFVVPVLVLGVAVAMIMERRVLRAAP